MHHGSLQAARKGVARSGPVGHHRCRYESKDRQTQIHRGYGRGRRDASIGHCERARRSARATGCFPGCGPAGFGSLADLHRAIDGTLATGRIGRPVFVRYSIYGLDPPRRLIDGVAALAGAAIRWVGGQVEFITAVGSETAGQLAATVVFKSGESAVMTCGRAAGPGSGVDVMILGSHGALYHDGGTSVLWVGRIYRPRCRRAAPRRDHRPFAGLRPGRAGANRRGGLRDRPFGILCVTGDQTHQESYAVAFAADPRARIIAVSDERDVDARRRELNQRLAARLRVPYIADLDEALAHSEVEVCSVCAPPERRGPDCNPLRPGKEAPLSRQVAGTGAWKTPMRWSLPCAPPACAATCSA